MPHLPKADDLFITRAFRVLYDNKNQSEPEKNNIYAFPNGPNHLPGSCWTVLVTTFQTEKKMLFLGKLMLKIHKTLLIAVFFLMSPVEQPVILSQINPVVSGIFT